MLNLLKRKDKELSTEKQISTLKGQIEELEHKSEILQAEDNLKGLKEKEAGIKDKIRAAVESGAPTDTLRKELKDLNDQIWESQLRLNKLRSGVDEEIQLIIADAMTRKREKLESLAGTTIKRVEELKVELTD